jgi:hypothetical protein
MGVLESGTFSRLKSAAVQRFEARVLSSAQPGIEGRAGTLGSDFRRDLLGAPEHAHRAHAAPA